MTQIDKIIEYEQGGLSDSESIALFQDLIDTGLAWKLQGHYGRMASYLIQKGVCHAPQMQSEGSTR